ncbi:MAG: hypothetical protein KDB39_15370 [Austwickia sp.]|nr:hypothetical protein [Austwickia sp.]
MEDIARQVAAGQHVLAVLPRYVYDDPFSTDELVSEMLGRIDYSRRVRGWDAGTVVEVFGQGLVLGDECPVTVPDLLRHPEGANRVLVCLVSDLASPLQANVPNFLRRLDAESRSVPVDQRCTLVLITGREHLPHFAGGDNREVTLATSWYWNRVSRWDVAAHVAEHVGGERAVLREVRQETIIELARWNFDLAVTLAASWSGDPQELGGFCTDGEPPPDLLLPGHGTATLRPPESLLQAWDDSLAECWHDRVCTAPIGLGVLERDTAQRHLWLGQARVLLPWIEQHRAQVEAATRAALGSARFEKALSEYTRAQEHREEPGFAPEIGLLNVVVQARLGRESYGLKTASRALWRARNEMAHLRALGSSQLEELVRACDHL